MAQKDNTIAQMIYNKITLAFPEDIESRFLEIYFRESLVQFRVAFILVILVYAAFGYLDTLIVPEYAKLFHIIRYFYVIPVLSVVVILSFTKVFQKFWQGMLLFSFIIGGSGITLMTIMVPDNYTYYSGMMLIFSAGYFFIKLRFFYSTIAGWGTLLIFNIGTIFYTQSSDVLLVSINFFYVSANIIGMFASYNIEYYFRYNFFLNHTLENLNRNLENTVEERTKELIKAKEKAEESDRLKSAFLANMSHEIRTPMNGILGFTELLKEPNLSGDEQEKYIGIIQKSGARMLNTINEIIDISKIEAGLMEVDIQESNINKIMLFAYQFFIPEAESKGITLSLCGNNKNKEIIVKTDEEKLNAVIFNLIKKALKYTHNGNIEFGFKIKESDIAGENHSKDVLEFFVKDTGIGIPVERQKAIFERFIQADVLDKNAYQGSGLGLSISKAYVEMLGGQIWVESEENVGSAFYFTIPYDIGVTQKGISLNQTEKPEKKNQAEINISGLKILITEDDEISEYFITEAVMEISKEIFKANTGLQAVNFCKDNNDIDLILMDVRMPEMDGYEAVRQIRLFNKE